MKNKTSKQSEKANLHAGHRKRMIARFENEGLLHFEEHNILELLLFYCIPRRDTNEIAHRLLNEFGSLHNVFTASHADLQKVNGIGPASATFLKTVFESSRQAELNYLTERPLLTFLQLHHIGIEWFAGKPAESVMAMLLDKDHRFLAFVPLSEEDNVAPDCIPEVLLSHAQRTNASFIVFYHSHPEGDTTPSDEDILSTRSLYQFLQKENLELLDHIIVSGLDSLSLFSEHRTAICRTDHF
ncbi:MAG: RadC family protein [Clostridia bacterium]|nr:RadC family protein [Clostridia bacterium]